jgi:[ribosomal protein S5]-alanine N-acetyltransferase
VTERLVLFVPGPRYAERMLDYVSENREHLAEWEPRRPGYYYTLALWKQDLAAARAEFQRGQSFRLVLLRREELKGPIIGVCNFRNVVRGAFQACHLGYSMDYRFQGQGLMFEALSAAIRYAFEDLNLHRVMANYMPHNARSARLLDKLGFVREGFARDYLHIAGKWQDHVLTALTNPHWKSPFTP